MWIESLQHLHVARGVHIGELQLGNADRGNQAEHDTEEATHHCLGQRCKDGPKLACTSHVHNFSRQHDSCKNLEQPRCKIKRITWSTCMVYQSARGHICPPMTDMMMAMHAPTWITRRLPTRVSCIAAHPVAQTFSQAQNKHFHVSTFCTVADTEILGAQTTSDVLIVGSCCISRANQTRQNTAETLQHHVPYPYNRSDDT